MAELFDYVVARDQEADLQRELNLRRLSDVYDPEFALTSRTRQLRVQGTEGEDVPKLRPLAVAFAIPREHRDPLWPASETKLFDWLGDSTARYAPMNNGRTFGGQPKPTHGGIIMAESDHHAGTHYRRYIAVERTGVIELGMGAKACIVHENQTGYLLTPIVAAVWQLLGFASDLYRHLGVNDPFTLALALRETQGALLGGLAQGWKEPWAGFRDYRPLCREPALLFLRRAIEPVLDVEQARSLAREIAYEIEAAWGHGGPGVIARCFKHMDDGSEGEFDLNAAQR